MPIKLPKTFNRRKSSGNVLEYDENHTPPPQSSFRVLDRPSENAHNFDSADKFRRTTAGRPNSSPGNQNRPLSYYDSSDTSYRGSGNANSDSNRFSYSSTVPSEHSRSQEDLPLRSLNSFAAPSNATPYVQDSEPQNSSAKPSFSLKAAGRAFSFGTRGSKSSGKENNSDGSIQTRPRTLTESSHNSITTTTPPKLQDFPTIYSDFSDFKGMLDKPVGTVSAEPGNVTPHAAHSESDFVLPSQNQTQEAWQTEGTSNNIPSQRSNHRPRQSQAGSRYSWGSNASEEKLISSPREPARAYSPGRVNGINRSPDLGQGSDEQTFLDAVYAGEALNAHYAPPPRNPSPENQPPYQRPQQPWAERRSPYGGPRTPPNGPPSNRFRQPPSTWMPRGPSPRSMYGSRASDGLGLEAAAARSSPNLGTDEEPLFDAPRRSQLLRSDARVSTMPGGQQNKIMTPAEFEKYKSQKEDPDREEDDMSEASSGDAYDDDDENERDKQAVRQRRRQEAHLAVYRQQMMKVTGEQPSDLPEVPRRAPPLERASQSLPNFLSNLSFDRPSESEHNGDGKRTNGDEDEDDDVPLGVLQAHGFPSKARPPTATARDRTSSVASRPQSQQTAYPPPPGSMRNEQSAGGGGALPAFAKNLPNDPYVGASLVRNPVRESLGYHQDGAGIHHQQPPPVTNLPPGGLVGVIAGEEHAKALRRGSPNTRGNFDPMPQQSISQMQMQMQQMGMPMPPQGPMSPSEQSQINMHQQMTQMMQMQMQWMQQMMQMQGIQQPQSQQMQMPQIPQQQFAQNGFLTAPDTNTRPHSMGSGGSSAGINQQGPQSIYGMPTPGQGYAPSIAPSERSNVGQPSRYRPVTPGGGAAQSRTSTMSAATATVFSNLKGSSKSRSSAFAQSRTKSMPLSATDQKHTIRAINKPKHGAVDDDDDDEGWAEMQKKRQERQSRWKSSKVNQAAMPGQQEGGLEALYYEA